ncbi:MAG: hypothetical protein O7H41_07830 [Planctomycetota bacterium]|nr:hypothetical protein [Planctomycetota bacterium]
MGLVPIISFVVLALGIGLLARTCMAGYRRLPFTHRRISTPRPTLWAIAAGGLIGLSLTSVGTAVLSVVFAFSSYAPFAQKHLVAEVRCTSSDRPGRLVLEYTPISTSGPGTREIYQLAGDQWAIGGEIVKWRPMFSFLGARTLFKVSRIEGRYLRAGDAMRGDRTVFDVNGGPDIELLRWNEKEGRFPYSLFVEAAYGNIVYDFPAETAIYAVYVTASGYQVDRHPYPSDLSRRD